MAGKDKKIKTTVKAGTFKGADDLQAKLKALVPVLEDIEFRGEDKKAVEAILDVLKNGEIEVTERGLKFVDTDENALKVYNLIQYGHPEDAAKGEAAKISDFSIEDVNNPDKMVEVLGRYVRVSDTARAIAESVHAAKSDSDKEKIDNLTNQLVDAQTSLKEAQNYIEELEGRVEKLEGDVYVKNSFLVKVFGKKDDDGKKALTYKRASKIATVAASVALGVTLLVSTVLGVSLGSANKKVEKAYNELASITNQYRDLQANYNELNDDYQVATGTLTNIEDVLNDNGYETEGVKLDELLQTIIENAGNGTVGGDVQEVYKRVMAHFVDLGLSLSDLQDENGNFTAEKVDSYLKEHVENVVKNASDMESITNSLNAVLGVVAKVDEAGNETGEYYSLADFETTSEAFDFVKTELTSLKDKLIAMDQQLDDVIKQNDGYVLQIEDLESDNKELQTTIATLNGEIVELDGTIQEQKAKIDSQLSTINALNTKVDELQDKYDLAIAESDRLEAENDRLVGEIEDLKEQNDQNQSNGQQSNPNNPDNEQGGAPVGDEDPDNDTHISGTVDPSEDDEPGPGKS